MSGKIGICALAVCVGLVAGAARATVVFQFQGFFGNPTISPGPFGASLDPAGNLYVTEVGATTGDVAEFDPNHNLLGRFASGGFISSVAVAPNGNVYTIGGASLNKYDSTHSFVGTTGSGLNSANDVVADATSNLWVADTFNNRVVKINAVTGATDIAATGGPTSFNHPFGVALDAAGSVYVADTGNNRVVVLDSSGNFVRAFSTVVAAHPGDHPLSLTVSPLDGRIFLTDDNGVLAFTNSGTFLDTYDGIFDIPRGVALDGNQLYVLDRSSSGGPAHNQIAVFAVPEPATLGILGMGALGLVKRRRKA